MLNRLLFDYINCLIKFNKILFYFIVDILITIMTRKNYNYLYDMIKQKIYVI